MIDEYTITLLQQTWWEFSIYKLVSYTL